ncbi:unnamed protein product [Darwinula stevensoni]|uniref:Prokaryotic-type class I peptide chain release factors domain-containing protein n=1 Tax=Darwinula stevensoni TaxID=69355 RepID=A0A7R9ACJ2_9CRUS|nr:unnamed protein product [Darwinula stevensoni]CAG0900358.1 unnamed protein product [Darwinula stevensoni]
MDKTALPNPEIIEGWLQSEEVSYNMPAGLEREGGIGPYKKHLCFHASASSGIEHSQILDFLKDLEKIPKDVIRLSDKQCGKALLLRPELFLLQEEMNELQALIADTSTTEEMRRLAREDILDLKQQLDALEQEATAVLSQEDAIYPQAAVLEVSAGVGGQEAMIFAGELFQMYERYSAFKNWNWLIVDKASTDLGGLRRGVAEVDGPGAYSLLRHEAGVHRIQRIPKTEKAGRVHTSTATVAVLPQPNEDPYIPQLYTLPVYITEGYTAWLFQNLFGKDTGMSTHIDVCLHEKDLKIETKRASGPGGQHVNKTDSAVRITHLPTGFVVECQTQRDQLQNRQQALKVLRARLYDLEMKSQQEQLLKARKSQVGTRSRSEKIRTYNFPQDRVTDHRVGITAHNLTGFFDGEYQLDEMIQHHILQEQSETFQDLMHTYEAWKKQN